MQNYYLTKLIDISLITNMQEMIAEYTKMPCVFSDSEGHFVTTRSKSCQFCDKYIRKNESGIERCEESLKRGTMQALVNENVNVYTCHAGLVKVVAPIMLEGIFIGSVSVGGALYDKAVEEVDNIAKDLKLNKDELNDAYRKIRRVSENDIEKAVHILDVVSCLLSNIALINYKNSNANIMYEKNIQSFMVLLSNLNDDFTKDINLYRDSVIAQINAEDQKDTPQMLKSLYGAMEEKANFISDTLEYAKMSSGQLAVNEYKYCPEQMLNIICGRYLKFAKEKNICIKCICDKDMPESLLGDAGRISQIVNKILHYTISMTDKGTVEINVFCEKKNYANLLVIKIKSEYVSIDDKEKTTMLDYSSNNILGLYYYGSNEITMVNQIINSLSGEFGIFDYMNTGIEFEIKLPQLRID